MTKYEILIREISIVPAYVEANSKDEAIAIINKEIEKGTDGFINWGDAEFSHILESDKWTITEFT